MPKILVIEDMPESAEMTAQLLRRYGHEVWIAATGVSGLGLAAKHIPDLIVCDYWLPDQDARAFLKQLRSLQKLKDIKVVVCTAAPQEVVTQKKGEFRFDGFIPKPYRLSNFMQAIEGQLAVAS